MAASGLVSVIPQPWTMVMPKRDWKPSMRARGTAEPPPVTSRSEERSTSAPGAAATRRRSFQMVGTPHERVGRRSAMIRARCSPWTYCWGRWRSAPVIHAEYGVPQALAWNMGTMASRRSRSLIDVAAVPAWDMVCRKVERWL